MRLIFEQVRVGGDRNFGYLLADREARVGVLVDPSYSPEVLVERAREQHVRITHVVNTHGHSDHVEGNERAVALTGARVAAHPAAPTPPDLPLEDGARLRVGALELACIHTPGHAEDHLVLHEPAEKILLTGDLIFVGKVGGTRTDADARTEWESLQKVLAAVGEDTTIWPGHDYGVRPCSTVGLEKRTNPFLLCPDAAAFLELKGSWPEYKKRLGLK